MPRRLLSLLALLLLVLAAQAAADGDKGDGEDGRDDDDSGAHGDSQEEGEERGDDDGDDEDDGNDDGDDAAGDGRRDRKSGKWKGDDEDGTGRAARSGDAPGADGGQTDGPPGQDRLRPVVGRAPDAGVEAIATALPGRAQFSFLVTSAAAADGVSFQATLPETGGAWSLSGPSLAGCRLEGRILGCTFAGLAPGDVRLVQATSAVGQAPPWELAAEGSVSATGDAVPGNDRSRAGLGLLLA